MEGGGAFSSAERALDMASNCNSKGMLNSMLRLCSNLAYMAYRREEGWESASSI